MTSAEGVSLLELRCNWWFYLEKAIVGKTVLRQTIDRPAV